MNAATLIGQDAYTTGLRQQAAVQAAATQGAKGGKNMDMKKVHDAAQKFESFFISQMLDHMTAGIETDPMFGGGHGEDMWKSMLNQEYGKEISKSGRMGITDQVMKGMIKMQEQREEAAKAAAQYSALPVAPVTAVERELTGQDPAGQELAEQDAAIALVAGSRMPVRR